jgi:hypothetical protein
MKNLIKYILVFLTISLGFVSCKKAPKFHKVKFEIEFIEDVPNGYSNFIDVTCSPQYRDEPATISSSDAEPGNVWTYEYWELMDGDQIVFNVSPQLYYRFYMRVYVDDELVSYKKIKTSETTYYSRIIEEEFGLDNDTRDTSSIKFIFYEDE